MDIQGIIQRLVSGADYTFLDGGGSSYDDILEWRDQRIKPTEAECLTQWDIMVAERNEQQTETEHIEAVKIAGKALISEHPWFGSATEQDVEDHIISKVDDSPERKILIEFGKILVGLRNIELAGLQRKE